MKAPIEQEFIQACEAYSDDLFRYCYFKLSDRERARDLVQETFMKTWSSLVKGEAIENMRAFFYKVLGNLIIDEYRKKKSLSLDELETTVGFDASYDDTGAWEDKIDAEFVLKLLDRLPEQYKDVILMKYIQELSLKEIADITYESENAIAVKLHRAMKKFKELCKDVIV